jgi:hypothetical protein
MSELSGAATVPAALPLLSRGKHRNPSRGACFMEFTSVLAGESFTDEPACVDGELAAVLRGANDKLSDADRLLLVPLLGRAIGLAVEPPAATTAACRAARGLRHRREQAACHRRQTGLLRRTVSDRFTAALGIRPSPAAQVWSGGGEELAWLFWDLMDEPTALRRSADYVRRLVDRLQLLHECYERAMDDLGLPRRTPGEAVPAGSVPADRVPAESR